MFHSRSAKIVAVVMVACAAITRVMAADECISVSGVGNTVVKELQGDLYVGPTEAQKKAQRELVEKLTQQLNECVGRQTYSEAVINIFLGIMRKEQVPRDDWPRVFGQIARRYRQMDEQLRAMKKQDLPDEIRRLLGKAEAARLAGELTKADELLEQAEESAIEHARRTKAAALESNRQAASVLVSRANLALAQMDRRRGAVFFQRAFEQRVDDETPETLWWLYEAGDAWNIEGNSKAAMRAYVRARDTALAQPNQNGSSIAWQRALAAGYDRVGDIYKVKGDLDAALENYGAALDIAKKHAAEASRFSWQRDLVVSHDRIGDILLEQRKFRGALDSYQEGMEIRKRLAPSDASSIERRRDLLVGHHKMGDAFRALGDLAAALVHYQDGLAIAKSLANIEPSNPMRKRDLSVSHDRVGNILRKQGDLLGAIKSYRLSMDLRRELARIDPSNTQAKRDLWVSNNKVAGALQVSGDLAHALESYQAGLSIMLELIDIDAGNAIWRSDRSISLDKLGDVSSAQRNFSTALEHYRASLDVRLALAAENVSNTVWQRGVWISYMKIGGALEAQGKRAEALRSYQDSLRVIEPLSGADLGKTGWATDELVSRWKIDVLSIDHNGGCQQRELLVRGSELLKVLQRDQRLEPNQSSWIGVIEDTLRSLEAQPCDGGRKASSGDVPSLVLVADGGAADDAPDSDVAGARNSDAG